MWNYIIVPHTSPPPILHILNEVLANKDNPQFLKLLYGTQVNSFQLKVRGVRDTPEKFCCFFHRHKKMGYFSAKK